MADIPANIVLSEARLSAIDGTKECDLCMETCDEQPYRLHRGRQMLYGPLPAELLDKVKEQELVQACFKCAANETDETYGGSIEQIVPEDRERFKLRQGKVAVLVHRFGMDFDEACAVLPDELDQYIEQEAGYWKRELRGGSPYPHPAMEEAEQNPNMTGCST